MATWRIIAAAILAVSGVAAVLIIMARTRERTRSGSHTVIVGTVAIAVLATLTVLSLTVLPVTPTWVISIAMLTTVAVLALAT